MRTINRDIAGAFIFSSDGHILLGKSNGKGVYQGVWIVPGGGIDPGETPFEAMKREVMEEVGLDITQATITAYDHDVQIGESEKMLKENDERVLVKMRFHDFVAEFSFPASEIAIDLQDDLGEAKWIPINELPSHPLTPSVTYRLQKLGYLPRKGN